jgi:cyclopropane-fatty-acyl-phospholipid synthase
VRKSLHATARNTREGSRRNIGAHYDVGNEFFALFLDPTMMYSSAVFERPDMTLEEASVAKLDRICRKLDLQPAIA